MSLLENRRNGYSGGAGCLSSLYVISHDHVTRILNPCPQAPLVVCSLPMELKYPADLVLDVLQQPVQKCERLVSGKTHSLNIYDKQDPVGDIHQV